MRRASAVVAVLLLLLAGSASARSSVKGPTSRELFPVIDQLLPLHEKKEAPKPGEWLFVHGDEESGQTFKQYARSRPVLPGRGRNVIHIQPLGTFSKAQRRVMDLTAEYMALYFNLEVKVDKDLPLSVIPAKAQRVHPSWGMKQILTTHVLDKLLRPRLPKTAVAYICLTSMDLYPGDDWNFVFGQASLRQRTGVQSIYRNGDPEESEEAFQLCLRRTIKTAVHETGHMFSMLHCIKYECCMNGSNSRPESDAQPFWLGPECVAKICWGMKVDPQDRYKALYLWCRENGFDKEAAFFAESLKTLGGTVPVVEEKARPTEKGGPREGDRVKAAPVN